MKNKDAIVNYIKKQGFDIVINTDSNVISEAKTSDNIHFKEYSWNNETGELLYTFTRIGSGAGICKTIQDSEILGNL